MTCVLGMVVRREREIRSFVKTPFYRVLGSFDVPGREGISVEAEWKAVKGSRYYETPVLYKENGFKEKKTAEELIRFLSAPPMEGTLVSMEKNGKRKCPAFIQPGGASERLLQNVQDQPRRDLEGGPGAV